MDGTAMHYPPTILCSVFDPVHYVTCDLPLKHGGAHKATVLWGDEESSRDDD